MTDKDTELSYADTVKQMALGPGAYKDIILDFEPDREILLGNPRVQYLTGILFPKNFKGLHTNIEDTEAMNFPNDEDMEEANDNETTGNSPKNDTLSFDFSYNNSMGLSCRLSPSCVRLKVIFSYGTYTLNKRKHIKIRFSQQEWNLLQELLRAEQDQTLSTKLMDMLEFNENALSAKLIKDKNLIYALWNGREHTLNVEEQTIKNKLLLLTKERYVRNPIEVEKELDIRNSEFDVVPGESKCVLAVYAYKNNKILKIQLQNAAIGDDKKILYQARLSLEQLDIDGNVLPIPAYDENQTFTMHLDEEQQILNQQYKEVKSYARGAFCSATWNTNHTIVETTYLPEENVKDQSVDNRSDDFSINPEILSLKNLSIWGWDDETLMEGLLDLRNKYESWHQKQINLNRQEENMQIILKKQEEHAQRLQENLEYIRHNPSALIAFRLANTAMYLQMIIARDPRFRKGNENRDFHRYNDIMFFRDYDNEITTSYRPFQLAFMLMNLKSTIEETSPGYVDLIWLKTGGGKTEAYLALTALTIITRKMRHPECSQGVSVIMRYTLRLLASQQFERASYLICALEFLRLHQNELEARYQILGTDPITSGMWVGSSVTPNNIEGLNTGDYRRIFEAVGGNNTDLNKLRAINPHPITTCPWCGHELIGLNENGMITIGYERRRRPSSFYMGCVNHDCCFYRNLPINYIDSQLYDNPPTLLFATVDKFARISSEQNSRSFFYPPETPDLSPDLIIQDELHLISGPLGSMVAFFENIVHELSTHGGQLNSPKIVASTATVRNTEHLVKQLYQQDVEIFPPLGINYDDNFYAHPQKTGKRNYMGIIPTGGTSANTEVRLISILFYAKLKLIARLLDGENGIWQTGNIPTGLDNYWTFLCYYNSLKDLGSSRNRVPQEISEQIRGMMGKFAMDQRLRFAISGLCARTEEFTSRVDSTGIKALLTRAETPVTMISNEHNENQRWIINYQNLDLALASNMISVGVDISRFNIMLFVGQPRSFAEYIQSSSRIARQHDGLVINLLNPVRSRELSIFESFRSYHQAYYKYVEPLSATPFTENIIDRLLNSLFVAYFRHLKKEAPGEVTNQDFDEFKKWICSRAEICNPEIIDYLKKKSDALFRAMEDAVQEGHNRWDGNNGLLTEKPFLLMQSLRDVAPDAYLTINNRN